MATHSLNSQGLLALIFKLSLLHKYNFSIYFYILLHLALTCSKLITFQTKQDLTYKNCIKSSSDFSLYVDFSAFDYFSIISMKKFIHHTKNIHKAKYCPRHLAADLDSTSPLWQRRNCKRTNLFCLASFLAYINFVEISFKFCTLHIYAVQCAK